MKTKLLKSLLTIACLLCSIGVYAHDFEVDGIYYNITSETDQTVEVTFRGDFNDSYSNEYTGTIEILATTIEPPTHVKFLPTLASFLAFLKSMCYD